ncbi:MAG: HEPN domain-containing protein [Candidatus Berkelbacteria bacterium]|nr:HEPN domain-containing protein [Candidatus Berkelbacteria bacterium]
MNKKIEKQIIEEMVESASERIGSAKLLAKFGNFRDSISRAYYANVDILRGLLELEDTYAKTHKGMIDKFYLLYVKTGKFDKKFHNFVVKAEMLRKDADYSPKFVATIDMVENAIEKTEMFLTEVKKYLDKVV